MTKLAGPVAVFLAAVLTVSAQRQTGMPAGTSTPELAGQTADSDSAQPRVFRVHVIDGRTGDPVAGARVQLWYDEPSGPGYVIRSGPRGDAAMPKPIGEPLRVLMSVHGHVDCRRTQTGLPPEGYNLAQIAQSGMAVENGCGRVSVRTSPGELVLFVRTARWYENLNKSPQ